MTYQVRFAMHPDGPYVERDEATLIHEFNEGRIKADTMVRRNEWNSWLPIVEALDLILPKLPPPPGPTSPRCSKCQGQLAPGYVLDHIHYSAMLSAWYAGKPQKSWSGALKAPRESGLPIRAYRCTTCGFLEFYAHEQFGPQ